MLRPGAERVARLGGVRKMMGWDGPLLTDSGGFQVMSLGPLRKLDEDGVTFKSHLDGSRYRLTPERSTEIQHLLDATITMAFDECTPFPATKSVAAESMALSMRWAKRSRDAFQPRTGYGQFGIVQGSIFLIFEQNPLPNSRILNLKVMRLADLLLVRGRKQCLRRWRRQRRSCKIVSLDI